MLSDVFHKLIQEVIPRYPRPDALAIDPERNGEQTHSQEAGSQDVEDGERTIFRKPRVHEVCLRKMLAVNDKLEMW